ncbi:MAG TPA: ABC transporter ATP-binding protein [Gaiellaceae bacterium]|nr:ABC transporter ATP-binding protein [Gaiellaceae bacterium]
MDALAASFRLPLRAFDVDVALAVDDTLALVGPSGAGKTSVLRALAGLTRPAAGTIALGAEVWFGEGVDVPAERRRVGLVFQEYALFPHLSVAANVAFGAADRSEVRSLLDRLGVAALAGARPDELSGGERQRVALARALARRPKLLLLDEPLSALDPHTRDGVRGDLRATLRESGVPALVVTHDFVDAAALADRIGVMDAGEVVQLGTAEELIRAPSSAFVARFAGGNVLRGRARRNGGLTAVELADCSVVWSTDEAEGDVAAVVFPWDVTLARTLPDDSAQNHLRAEVASVVPVANRVRVTVGAVTAEITAESAARLGVREREALVASWKATATRLVAV